ncbi:glutathione ABC transporter substrate-binding protein [Aliibacillus thermotolerans]|uniref:Glutathione ABC transporter substrate-binding protein n=1 Tax=Aliibacillus thermotolerans TaxID=1834418 RepID=A0ABW0U8Y0_9BACI
MKSRIKWLFCMAMAIVLASIIVGCGNDTNDTKEIRDGNSHIKTELSTEESDFRGGDLVIATSADAVSLDPATSNDIPSVNVQENIYETLIDFDENMELIPKLATDWKEIDETTWEFTLREGVTFHDGSPFNASVVKANMERVIDPAVASPRALLYDMITDIEVIDDYTVRIKTEKPFAPLPAHLAHNGGGMVSLEAIEKDYEAMENGEEPGSYINEHPIGTGYFQFQEWEREQYIQLVRYEDYWDEPAYVDTVTFKVVPEDLTRIAELETGDVHISDPISPSDVARIEKTDGLYVNIQDSVNLSYIGFNVQKEPFDDVRVRQAVAMAIDKEQIIDGLYGGVGIPAIGPLAPIVFGYDDSVKGLPFDQEEAKALLREAGYKDGFTTTIWTNDHRERIDTAINIQAQLKEIGIEVEIKTMDWGTYLERTANGEHDIFLLGWSASTADADYGLYALFHSSQVGAPGNRTFIQNHEIDSMLDEARETLDEEKRLALYKEVQEKLMEESPMIYLHHQQFLLGARDEVRNLEQSPNQLLQLKEVYLEE